MHPLLGLIARTHGHDQALRTSEDTSVFNRPECSANYLFLWRFARRFFLRLCFAIFAFRTFLPPANVFPPSLKRPCR